MIISEAICRLIVRIDNLYAKISDPPNHLKNKVPDLVEKVQLLEDQMCDLVELL